PLLIVSSGAKFVELRELLTAFRLATESSERLPEHIARLWELGRASNRPPQRHFRRAVAARVELNLSYCRQGLGIFRTNQRRRNQLDERIIGAANPDVREPEIGMCASVVGIEPKTASQRIEDAV